MHWAVVSVSGNESGPAAAKTSAAWQTSVLVIAPPKETPTTYIRLLSTLAMPRM